MKAFAIAILLTLLVLLFTLAGCSNEPASGVDSIFINARAYTLNDDMPWADAIAVDGNSIVYVGSNAGALALAGSNTMQHDLDGKMLLPGFIDSHMHPIEGGAYAKALSLDTFGSVDEWIQSIGDYAAANTDAPLLFGYGFLATTFGPTGPTRQLIDDVVSDRPVLIMDEGFHAAWANTMTLKMLNITQDTVDPVPGFSYYKRDANGDATGYLLEATAGMAMESLNVITDDAIIDGVAYVIDVLNSYGVTSVFDASASDQGDSLLAILQELEGAGDMTVRIVGSYKPEEPEDFESAADRADHYRSTIKGDNFHYRFLKIMHDGTVEGRTAAMFEDYQGEPGNSGETVYTQKQITHMVVAAAAKQIDVHIHALGERAIHEALNSIAVARAEHPESSSRFAICHIEVITDQDLPRFAELNVIAQSTPLWASYDTYGEKFVSEDQFERFWRFNSLHSLGVRLTWGSDFPASGAGMLGMSPIFNMETGRTRQFAGEPDSRIQPRASERLDMDTMIRGYTIDAAYQLHLEDEIGSLEVGKKADLVVLDKNLFEIELYDIHDTQVVMTLKDGDVVYAAERE